MTTLTVPQVAVSAFFESDMAGRAAVTEAIQPAARNEGFMVITGLPKWVALDEARRH